MNFPLYARVARAEANVRREAGFVMAARLSGNGEMRILLGQVLPNVMPIMVAEGAAFIVSGEWWIALFPGAALMIAVFCFNLLGDGLRDIVDPQRRT